MAQPASPAFDARQFRDALGNYATGVTVISTRGAAGEPVGLTASSFNWASRRPPLVLFSLGRGAKSLNAFVEHRHFAVNVLKLEQQALAQRFAVPRDDKWAGVAHHYGDSGCPLLDEALTVFECRLRNSYDGGDHVIFVGEVLRLHGGGADRPLIFHRGAFTSVKPET